MTDTPGPTSGRLDGALPDHPANVAEVVRSEERLQVGRTVRVSGRAVLRKYVVTETVTQTFEVRREEVRLDVEPVDGTGGSIVATSDEVPFADRVIEVVLHREVPVVQLHVEATERVRVHVDTVTEQVAVSADRRREEIDLDASGA